MPIEVHDEENGAFVVIHVTGKLLQSDYAGFVEAFDQRLRQRGKLRVLFNMTGFHGWEPAAMWEDIKFDLRHFADITKLAMVGDRQWQHGAAEFFRPFTRAATRYFDTRESEAARRWLTEP